MAVFFRGQRDSVKCGYNGYVYNRGSTNVTTQNWRCELNRSTKCKGSASTTVTYGDGCVVKELLPHNHAPDPVNVELGRKMEETLAAAVQGNEPPRRLLSNHRIGLSEEAQTRAPKRKAIAQRIQRKRRRREGLQTEPVNITFRVPEKYRTVTHGNQEVRFLLHDDADEVNEEEYEDLELEDVLADRLIVFASDAMLDVLRSVGHWIMDGTFKESPGMFSQLYTIHAVVQDYVFPCVYALLPNKAQTTYERLFETLKQKRPHLSPEVVILDFEKAAHKALMREFPGTRIQGCLFHLSQSVWRKTQALGLKNAYIEDEEVRRIVKSLPALAFLPPDEVTEGFNHLDNEADELEMWSDELKLLLDYFEETYIGAVRRGRRRPAQFPPNTWSVHQAARDGNHRTQNRIEGWHRAIQTHFDGAHPSMWRFLEGIKREEGYQYSELVRSRAGAGGPKTKKKYEAVTERLRRMCTTYNSEEREAFIKSITFNIELNV